MFHLQAEQSAVREKTRQGQDQDQDQDQEWFISTDKYAKHARYTKFDKNAQHGEENKCSRRRVGEARTP